jgi:hypothetical protein
MAMLNIPIRFDDLLKAVDKLTADQKRVLKQRLDEDWAARLGSALADIHADMPAGISEAEIEADVEAAIDETRRSKS